MLVKAAWVLLALIHLTPAVALFRPAMLTSLYGIEPGGTAFALLHHRAALFLGIVVLCLWAGMDTTVRPVAAVVTGLSMIAFLLLYWQSGSPVSLKTIAVADLIGLVPLAFVSWQGFRP